jgi:hypothetical protein
MKKTYFSIFAVQWSNVVEAEPKDQSSQNRRKKDPKDKSTKKEKENRFQYWKTKTFLPKTEIIWKFFFISCQTKLQK